MPGWVSPRLGIRFELVDGQLELYTPSGEKFATYLELAEQRRAALQEVALAQQQATLAQQQATLAQQQASLAQQQATLAQHEVELARLATEKLAAQLRALGVDPNL